MILGVIYLIGLCVPPAAGIFMAVHHRTRRETLMLAITSMLLVYLVLIIVPFFAYGLHQENLEHVSNGAFDPKGYPLFSSESDVGCWLHLVALLTVLFTPMLISLFGARLFIQVARGWHHLQEVARSTSAALLALSAALLAFMATPLGRTIVAWHLD